MKAQTSVEKIKSAIMNAERITGKNLTLPVLGALLLEATGKTIMIRATNLSLGIEIRIPAKVEKEGIVAVSGSLLSSFFGTLSKDDTVNFDAVDTTLVITTSFTKVTVKCLPHEDFPTLPNVDGPKLTLPVKKFIDGLKSVSFAASYSEIKPELSSVYMYSLEDMLVFVATDSFRLAEKRIKIKSVNEFPAILIPMKNTVELIRLLAEVEGDIELVSTKNQLSITLPTMYLTTRLIDGIFPDYKQIIPKTFSTEVIVLKQDLLNALKISNLFSDKFNQITLHIDPPARTFELYAKNADVGETTTKVSAALTGTIVDINCNQKYFIDAFQSFSSDSISLEYETNRPIIMKGVSDQSFMYLVMPMNR